MQTDPSRRQFIEQLGLGGAALLTGGYTATARGFSRSITEMKTLPAALPPTRPSTWLASARADAAGG